MHFYYLDEAGCTGRNLSDRNQPIFVLGGISVRDEGWNQSQQAMLAIFNRYFGGSIPEDFELHAEELLSPEGSGAFAGHSRLRRNGLAKEILALLSKRKHHVHLIALDKQRIAARTCTASLVYSPSVPYLLAYDYLITYIDAFVKDRLGSSARAMILLDVKDEFRQGVELITNNRRVEGPKAHRVNRVVEFSYPIDSRKNPMVQLSDLVVFCAKKFLELEARYRGDWPEDAKRFYAECYRLIDDRIQRKDLVPRSGRDMSGLNEYLASVQAKPGRHWKRS